MSGLDVFWDRFFDVVRAARPALDGTLPVAVIFLPAVLGPDGMAEMDQTGGPPRVLWPKEFPEEEREPLLRHIAKAYRMDVVDRLEGP